MKNKNKALLLVLSVALVVVASVFTTLAYFTSTDEVTNTFTVGNVELGGDDPDTEEKENQQGLDEAKVNVYGVPVDENGKVPGDDGYDAVKPHARVDANEYKLIPGHTYIKDPTVHVNKASEPCWIFVKVENGIEAIEAEGVTKIANQIVSSEYGWTKLTGVNGVDNVYYKDWSATSNDFDLEVFGSFTIDGNASAETLKEYADKEIKVTVYAIQKDGLTTVVSAWEAGNKSTDEGGWIKDTTGSDNGTN